MEGKKQIYSPPNKIFKKMFWGHLTWKERFLCNSVYLQDVIIELCCKIPGIRLFKNKDIGYSEHLDILGRLMHVS